jgi:hypothetical protein
VRFGDSSSPGNLEVKVIDARSHIPTSIQRLIWGIFNF